MGTGKGVLQTNEKYVAFLSHPHQGVGWDEAVSSSLALKTLSVHSDMWAARLASQVR